MFGKLNKVLLGAALIGGVISVSEGLASDAISYHLFCGSPHPEITPLSSTPDEELQKDLADCCDKFQAADSAYFDEIAEVFIPRLRNIFIGKENKIAVAEICSLEENVFENKILIAEAAPKILKERKGLPNAAYQLACMYDQESVYSLALLWSKVAYDLGIRPGKLLGRELIAKMKV